tara:strand:+ start:514 stop:1140 length:627 start_codon:yes stop_codon:yes gene_type:complete
MPRFTGQNKKHTNPRWFLNENSEFFQHAMGVDNRDEAIDAILDFESEVYGRKMSDLEDLADLSDEELAQKYASITDTEDYRNMIAKMGDDEIDQTDDELDMLPKQSGMGRRLEENITYKVIEDEDDGGPTVIIKGIGTTFQEMLEQMNGQTITFADGDVEQFNFSDMNGAKDAEEAALNMIKLGIAKHYVEAWAIMNNMQATQKGARD